MKSMLTALLICVAGAASAQTVPVSPGGGASPGQMQLRQMEDAERAACRSDAARRGVTGSGMGDAVISCMMQKDPMVGRRMACARSARQSGVQPAGMPMAVHACMNGI